MQEVKEKQVENTGDDTPVVKVVVEASTAKKVGLIETEKRLWDNYRVIGEVRKSNKINFVVGAGIRDGVRYLNIREFYFRKSDETWRPGRDGITIPLIVPADDATVMLTPLKSLMTLMLEAANAVIDMELYDPEHAVIVPMKHKGDK